jgi:hypothetical protein
MDQEWINMVHRWICETLEQTDDKGAPDLRTEEEDNEDGIETMFVRNTDMLILHCNNCLFHGMLNAKKNKHLIGLKKHWKIKKRVVLCPRCGKEIPIKD